MRNSMFVTATVVSILAAVVSAADQVPADWQSDVNSAWEATKSSGRPLVLFVSSQGCHYCTQMERDTLQDPGVAGDVARWYVAAHVDATQNRQLVQRLGVTAYPTTFILSPEGRVVDTIRGYVGPRELRQRLWTQAGQPQASR